VLVQLSRETQREKGWRGAFELALAGFALVFAPGVPRHGVSRRIEDAAERGRLQEIVQRIAPPEGGLIARTAARGCSADELSTERDHLVARWREVAERARGLPAPAIVTAPEHPAVQFVREHFGAGLAEVVVDGEDHPALEQALALAPASIRPATRRHEGPAPAVEAYGLLRALDEALADVVPLPSGGRLAIEATRALTAVDVDSGGEDAASFHETALRTNLEAASEAARQVRLRAAAGLIAIDFIDLDSPASRALVDEALARAFSADPLRIRVAPLSEFCVAEITRQRRRQPLQLALTEPCRHCGQGRTPTPEFLARRLLRELRRRSHGRPDFRARISAPAATAGAGQAILEQCGAASGLPSPRRIQWREGAPEVTLL
jgi:Rne/Rng family ribonuclease